MNKSQLFALIPDYYASSELMDNILEAFTTQMTKLQTKYENACKQLSINTADTDLYRWENDFGLTVNVNYNLDFRRSKVRAQMRGQGTVTPAFIKNIAESFQNGTVQVIENNAHYSFTIKFVGIKGLPPNIDDLKTAMRKLKPSHLSITYELTWITWDEIENYNKNFNTWDSLNLTWDNFEKYME